MIFYYYYYVFLYWIYIKIFKIILIIINYININYLIIFKFNLKYKNEEKILKKIIKKNRIFN